MRDVEEDTWFLIETICIIGFTSDFVIRLLCCPDCGAFWGEFMNMVDFVAIVPYYVEFLIVAIAPSIEIPQYLRVIRVVRLARIVRHMAYRYFCDAYIGISHVCMRSCESLR
jgi:potassium voltage-gated channel Shaw-related subfamily C protein 4